MVKINELLEEIKEVEAQMLKSNISDRAKYALGRRLIRLKKDRDIYYNITKYGRERNKRTG